MSTTFRQLESAEEAKFIDGYGVSALECWYRRMRDIPIERFEIGDLARACRQGEYAEHVVPIALRRLEEDPLAGSMDEAELVIAVGSLPLSSWCKSAEARAAWLRVLDSAVEQIESGKTQDKLRELRRAIPDEGE